MSLHFFIGGVVYNGYSIPAINSSYLGDVAVSNLTCNTDVICTNETIPIDSCDYVHIACIRGKPKGIKEYIILYMLTVTFQNVKKVMRGYIMRHTLIMKMVCLLLAYHRDVY